VIPAQSLLKFMADNPLEVTSMTLFRRVAQAGALLIALLMPSVAEAQRSDSYTWKIGVSAGSMLFKTQTEDTKVIPSFGAHFLIMASRVGLQVGIDEGFGSDERSGLALFNDLRRFQAVAIAFPFSSPIEPYFGIGGGVLQVVGPRVDPVVIDPIDRDDLDDFFDEASTSGFLTVMAGVQGRWGRFTAFGQYQLGTAPNDDKILSGVLHSFHGGLRIGLGSAREGIRAGGY